MTSEEKAIIFRFVVSVDKGDRWSDLPLNAERRKRPGATDNSDAVLKMVLPFPVHRA